VDFSASEGFWLHFAGTLILLLCLAFYQSVGARASSGGRSADRGAKARGWRVGHLGRDRVYYEEFREGAWRRLEIDGEMLTGPAHHVLYFASPEKWEAYPEWARGRREEIIDRIKSEFGAPDYEHHGA